MRPTPRVVVSFQACWPARPLPSLQGGSPPARPGVGALLSACAFWLRSVMARLVPALSPAPRPRPLLQHGQASTLAALTLASGGLGLVSTTMLFRLIPADWARPLSWLCLLGGSSLLGGAAALVRPALGRTLEQQRWWRLLGYALLLILCCTASATAVSWLVGRELTDALLPMTIAASILSVGALELIRTSITAQTALAIASEQLGHQVAASAQPAARALTLDQPSPPSPARGSTHGDVQAQAHATTPQVTVHCLGELEVFLDGNKLPDGAWGGRSSGHRHAKGVFAFLLANRERMVGRDELIEAIWGEGADLAALENRLDRTVSALRRTLEPTLRAGARSAYVVTEVGGYRLGPSLTWRVDAEEFARLVQEADGLLGRGDDNSALARYLEAEALYCGDYMVHCPFIDRSHLITVRREALRQQYIQVLLSIAQVHQRMGSPELQIRYLKRAALQDEFNEKAYQALIAALWGQRRQAEARQVCRRHRDELMAAELPCSEACFRGGGAGGEVGS